MGWGYNYLPITWQGWVMTLAITPVLLATVFAGDPSTMHTHNPALRSSSRRRRCSASAPRICRP